MKAEKSGKTVRRTRRNPLHEKVRDGKSREWRGLLTELIAAGDTPGLETELGRTAEDIRSGSAGTGTDERKLLADRVTPLGQAAGYGDTLAIRMLLDAGARAEDTDRKNEMAPLRHAVCAGMAAAAGLLAEAAPETAAQITENDWKRCPPERLPAVVRRIAEARGGTLPAECRPLWEIAGGFEKEPRATMWAWEHEAQQDKQRLRDFLTESGCLKPSTNQALAEAMRGRLEGFRAMVRAGAEPPEGEVFGTWLPRLESGTKPGELAREIAAWVESGKAADGREGAEVVPGEGDEARVP